MSRADVMTVSKAVCAKSALPPLPLGEGRGEGLSYVVNGFGWSPNPPGPHPNPLPGGEGTRLITLHTRPGSYRSRGVVMVITLLAIILIASLLFYVFNVGTSVQGRAVTQHAADAAAIGGAGQVARAMNTVAMNNVETARLIAAVSVLDGVPMAVDLSITDASEEELGDADALAQAVRGQLNAGVIDDWFERKLRGLMDENDPDSLVSELRYLRELDEVFRDNPDLIPNMTRYHAPSGAMGKMHQAMRSMDAHSRAAMQSLGQAAQLAAGESALTNLGRDGTDSAGLLLPAAPSIPWQRGVFDDFERPIKKGLLPGRDDSLDVDTVSKGLGQIDDKLTNRGPWDAVFGWRTTDRIAADPGGTVGMPGINHPPKVQVSGPSPGREPEEYRVFGPQSVLLGVIQPRRYSRLANHIWDQYSIKSTYLWADTAPRTVLDSNWEIDIEHDDERSSDRNDEYVFGLAASDIRETAYVIVEIKSRLADEQGHPGRQGQTWNYVDAFGRDSPFILFFGGWRDPNQGPPITINSQSVTGPPTWKKVQNHIWRLSAVYETDPDGPHLGGDPDIGLPPKRIGTDGDGNPVYDAQEVYWEMDFMLVGVNVGKNIEVRNPWAGFDRNAEDAPAPYDLIHDVLPPNDAAARNQYLTFLGVARQSNRPRFWPTRFDGDKPYPYNTAVAQAYVFNNHSWDLWTQTWQAQLEPVSRLRFSDWVAAADDAVTVAQTAPGPDPAAVREMAEQLRSVESLAPVMLNH